MSEDNQQFNMADLAKIREAAKDQPEVAIWKMKPCTVEEKIRFIREIAATYLGPGVTEEEAIQIAMGQLRCLDLLE